MDGLQNSNSIEAEGAEHLAEPLGKLTSLTSLDLVHACVDMTEWFAAKLPGKGLSGDGRDMARFGCSGVERWRSMKGSALICLCALGRDEVCSGNVCIDRGWCYG